MVDSNCHLGSLWFLYVNYCARNTSGQGLTRISWIFDRIVQTAEYMFGTIKVVLGVTK